MDTRPTYNQRKFVEEDIEKACHWAENMVEHDKARAAPKHTETYDSKLLKEHREDIYKDIRGEE